MGRSGMSLPRTLVKVKSAAAPSDTAALPQSFLVRHTTCTEYLSVDLRSVDRLTEIQGPKENPEKNPNEICRQEPDQQRHGRTECARGGLEARNFLSL